MQKKIVRRIMLTLVVVLALAIGPEIVVSTFSIGAAREVRAMLAPDAPVWELPQHVTLHIAGKTATYTQGTDGYAQLLALLRLKHSEVEVEKAGPYPSSYNTSNYGELTIRHLGLPFHCKLKRSIVNPNYLLIAIPYGNGRPGAALPWIIDDNRLGEFVKSNKETK